MSTCHTTGIKIHSQHPPSHPSTRLRLHLTRRPLRPHLANLPPLRHAPRPPRRTRHRALGLLRLLLALALRLLLLPRLDGGHARRGAGFGPLGAALFDHVEGGADDAALLLDGAAGALFGDFLACAREPLACRFRWG